MKKNYFLLLLLVIFMVFFSCKTTKTIQSTQKESTLSEKQKIDFTYSFFEATKYHLNGNLDLATNLYQGCLKIDSSSSVCYYNLARIYLQKKDFIVAENYASKAIFYHPENESYLYLAALVYQQNNKMEQAESLFKKLIKKDERNLNYYLSLADLYLQKKDNKEAIMVYDQIDEKFGISEMIALQKSKIYLSMKKIPEARKEIEKLAKANAYSLQYSRMLADFDVQTKNYDKAIVNYKKILEKHPEDGYSHIGLAECYRQKEDINKAFEHIKLAFASDEVPSDVKVNLFLSIWQGTEKSPELSPTLFELTQILVKKYPENPDINTIYADFLLRDNKIKEAREVIRNVLKVKKDKYVLWEQLILIENKFSDWNACYEESSEALNYFPNQTFLYFFKGFSAYQLGKYKEALETFEFGYKITTKDNPLYTDYLSLLAESYHKNNDNKTAYSYYDKVLEIDPENVGVLNNYAYFMSEEKNADLEKAKKMSYKTIQKEPKNATYLDTYAWILFKKKEYKEALVYIKQAVENNTGKSAVIIEHYGDILFFNDQKSEALKYWKKAKETGKASEFLDEKINKKTYVE